MHTGPRGVKWNAMVECDMEIIRDSGAIVKILGKIRWLQHPDKAKIAAEKFVRNRPLRSTLERFEVPEDKIEEYEKILRHRLGERLAWELQAQLTFEEETFII